MSTLHVSSKSFPRYRWVVLGVMFAAQLSGSMALYVVPALGPLIQPELGLTNAELGSFSMACLAGAWLVLLVSGSLTDRFGARIMVSLGLLATGALLVTMPLAGLYWQALALMLIAGMAVGGTTPGMSKAIMEGFPPESRATAMGLKHSATPVAGVIVASGLPMIALAWGRRAAIVVVGGMAIVASVGVAVLYREARPVERVRGSRPGTRAVLGEMVRNRRLWLLSVIALLFLVVQGGMVTYLVLYFKNLVLVPTVPDERARIVAAGGFLALCQAGSVVGRISWGVVSDRLFQGQRLIAMVIIGAVSAGMALAQAYLKPGFPLWLLALLVFIYGSTGLGWNGLYHTLAMESAGRGQAATGLGWSMTMSQFGQIMGPPLLGLLLDTTGSYQLVWLSLSVAPAIAAMIAASTVRAERRLVLGATG